MKVITYEQAYKDHSYLWVTIGAAFDMTGGYVDQDDLNKLLYSPTKKTAKECLCGQIAYWFDVGIDEYRQISFESILREYPEIEKIMERHNILRHW